MFGSRTRGAAGTNDNHSTAKIAPAGRRAEDFHRLQLERLKDQIEVVVTGETVSIKAEKKHEEEIKEAFRPESLLPMKVSETQVRDSIRRWYGSRWFAPSKLKRAALTDTVKGLYIPYWTFDAQVHGDWTAESGYYYYETEFYTHFGYPPYWDAPPAWGSATEPVLCAVRPTWVPWRATTPLVSPSTRKRRASSREGANMPESRPTGSCAGIRRGPESRTRRTSARAPRTRSARAGSASGARAA